MASGETLLTERQDAAFLAALSSCQCIGGFGYSDTGLWFAGEGVVMMTVEIHSGSIVMLLSIPIINLRRPFCALTGWKRGKRLFFFFFNVTIFKKFIH